MQFAYGATRRRFAHSVRAVFLFFGPVCHNNQSLSTVGSKAAAFACRLDDDAGVNMPYCTRTLLPTTHLAGSPLPSYARLARGRAACRRCLLLFYHLFHADMHFLPFATYTSSLITVG